MLPVNGWRTFLRRPSHRRCLLTEYERAPDTPGPMERLREHMEEEGITQAALGRKVGVNQSTVSDWLNGRIEPTVPNLKKLRRVTGLSVDELLDIDDD